MRLTEQQWQDILTCAIAAENSDNGEVIAAAQRTHDWVTQQTWDDPETAECECGGMIELIDGEWYHTRIEDFSHTPAPALA